MNVKENLAKNIMFNRKKLKLSQKQLGEALGVKNSTISNWESSLNMPDAEQIFAMSEIFNVPISDLYGIDTPDILKMSRDQLSTELINLLTNLMETNPEAAESVISLMRKLSEKQ
jgi:transcriptional regulator with XRE-family HTH domain